MERCGEWGEVCLWWERVLGGITAMWITLWIIALSGHMYILEGSCTISRHPLCTPPNPWDWVLPFAGVVGALASSIGTSMLLRHRARFLDSSSLPLAPTVSRS
jgi:hypothetical protein